MPLALWAMLFAIPATAQGIDLSGGGPVEVTAADGIEWRQAEQVIIARGSARAVRGDVTVTADRLIARYRSAPVAAGTPAAAAPATGGGELWRLEAEGRVRIATATDQGQGDRAVYDIDQAVLVLSGRELALTTPQQTITARDSLEYWSAKKMAVARGNALVVEPAENRRIGADTLVAYFRDAPVATAAAPPRAAPIAAGPAAAPAAAPPGSGRLDRVEAFGNVEIRTLEEVVRGERGVYSGTTGLARLLGGVRITRGDNQLNGREALVNMNTGVARLVAAPGQRVQGLVVQQQGTPAPGATSSRGGGAATEPPRGGPATEPRAR